jgi:Fe-S-cluster containining protein
VSAFLRMVGGQQYSVGQGLLPPIECFCCGVCCESYQPKVTRREIKTIAAHLGIGKHKFISRYVQRVPLREEFLLQRSEKGCVFLSPSEQNTKAKCTIYSVRPRACRDWVASLSQPECREGFRRINPPRPLMTPKEMYSSLEAVNKLSIAVLGERK